ncbi:DMT family transporter [Lacticaseibacillus porcinae]|uniref:DMT family transporter n=1 Tax=Lacticaseibacillus porcinae TaxID=1123687 RepID=UPI000F7727D4|nr:DMT family transporter [Lacticaseibacillus porcinae]
MTEKRTTGHIAALITILIWGTTFIATKVLLRSFNPVTILLTRFVIGYLTLLLWQPGILHLAQRKQEWLFVGAGFSGITIYYLLENLALTQTTASNVGIIVTVSPFLTALLSMWFLKAKRANMWFYVGFIVAISGVILISDPATAAGQGSLVGDGLALLASFTWAIYSVLTTKIGELNLNLIQSTRHVFFYGLLFMLPIAYLLGFDLNLNALQQPQNWGNFLFLGIGACALCFVTWNLAVKRLGTVASSVYIYLVPVITLIFSVILLHEPLTVPLMIGAALTLVGLWLSGRN